MSEIRYPSMHNPYKWNEYIGAGLMAGEVNPAIVYGASNPGSRELVNEIHWSTGELNSVRAQWYPPPWIDINELLLGFKLKYYGVIMTDVVNPTTKNIVMQWSSRIIRAGDNFANNDVLYGSSVEIEIPGAAQNEFVMGYNATPGNCVISIPNSKGAHVNGEYCVDILFSRQQSDPDDDFDGSLGLLGIGVEAKCNWAGAEEWPVI